MVKCIEECNGNTYLKLAYTDESKDSIKCEELWNYGDALISIINNSDIYNKKYMKIKYNSEDGLPLKKTLEPYNMSRVVWSVFHEERKYYWQVLLDERLYKL